MPKNPRTPKADRELLREIYVFVAMDHRATHPWRKALKRWQKKVERRHGWTAFEQIEVAVLDQAPKKDFPKFSDENLHHG